MGDVLSGTIGFLMGALVGVGLMAIANKDSYLDGYRDAWAELHRRNQAEKRRKESAQKR